MCLPQIFSIKIKTLLLTITLAITSSYANAVAEQSSIYTITVWKIHPGKHVEFIKYMKEWEQVYIDIKLPPMKWYRKISGDSYDFISVSPPFNNAKEHEMEKVGKARGLPIGYNYTLKLNEYVDTYTSTYVEGPQSMADLLLQVTE
jgi:hypothetical protein